MSLVSNMRYDYDYEIIQYLKLALILPFRLVNSEFWGDECGHKDAWNGVIVLQETFCLGFPLPRLQSVQCTE